MRVKEIVMIELTEQQRRQLQATDEPRFVDTETGKTYVLVSAEIYERIKELLEDELRVTGEMVDRLMEEEDSDDATLAFYQQQYGRKS
jgi:PHD/YefM family antitoxin component YafN of YafNO toxin-antitoxin module